MRIALLGATSHIARGLAYSFSYSDVTGECHLFARNTAGVTAFLEALTTRKDSIIFPVHDLNSLEGSELRYDVIINCIGIGDPTKLRHAGAEIFFVTEEYDRRVIHYLKRYPESRYASFSSGAVYGRDFLSPADETTVLQVPVNNLSIEHSYTMAKVNSEAKHRALHEYHIVDIRVFSYFSRFIDLESDFFLTDIARALRTDSVFQTNSTNMVRDYVTPHDLFSLLMLCVERTPLNDSFDLYSRGEVSKFDVLNHMKKNFGLRYCVGDDSDYATITGGKSNYYSTNDKARKLGYQPKYSSLEGIDIEMRALLEDKV